MSYADPTPLFTLVREGTVQTTDGVVYTTASTTADYPDEIELVDKWGHPCAVPVGQPWQSTDPRHEYTNGSIGETSRLMRHYLSIGVDFITSETRRKLERWMLDRARVLFTPGYGRATEFAYRPIGLTSPSISDLTGRWTISPSYDANYSHTWDAEWLRGFMRTFTHTRHLKTPFGTGYVGEGPIVQTETPSHITGSTEAATGWTLSSESVAVDLVCSEKANGFGFTSYEKSARYVGSSEATTARKIYRTVATGASAGTLWCCVWIKGHVGAGSSLLLSNNHGTLETKTVSLADRDLGEWTPVWISLHAANWDSSTAVLSVIAIGKSAQADYADFEVGPTMVTYMADSTGICNGYPLWKPYNAASARTIDNLSVANFVRPQSGSWLCSFYVPDCFANSLDQAFTSFLYSDNGSLGGLAYINRAYNEATCRFRWYRDITYFVEATGLSFTPGTAHSIAVTWTSGRLRVYADGVLKTEVTAAATVQYSVPGASTLKLFGDYSWGVWPIVPLATRIDGRWMDSDEIANLHATMAYQAALEYTIPARGRVYRIRSIPSTPRSVSGDVHWIGQIELEQVDYVAAKADETSKEP